MLFALLCCRMYAQRRVRDCFKENKGLSDHSEIDRQYRQGLDALDMLRRQVRQSGMSPVHVQCVTVQDHFCDLQDQCDSVCSKPRLMSARFKLIQNSALGLEHDLHVLFHWMWLILWLTRSHSPHSVLHSPSVAVLSE